MQSLIQSFIHSLITAMRLWTEIYDFFFTNYAPNYTIQSVSQQNSQPTSQPTNLLVQGLHWTGQYNSHAYWAKLRTKQLIIKLIKTPQSSLPSNTNTHRWRWVEVCLSQWQQHALSGFLQTTAPTTDGSSTFPTSSQSTYTTHTTFNSINAFPLYSSVLAVRPKRCHTLGHLI